MAKLFAKTAWPASMQVWSEPRLGMFVSGVCPESIILPQDRVLVSIVRLESIQMVLEPCLRTLVSDVCPESMVLPQDRVLASIVRPAHIQEPRLLMLVSDVSPESMVLPQDRVLPSIVRLERIILTQDWISALTVPRARTLRQGLLW